MLYDNNIKLDFCDVLIVPKPSFISSRKEVNLFCNLAFNKAGFSLTNYVPVCASNMDGVGTLSMAEKLATRHMSTCLTKHLTHQILLDNKPEFKKDDFIFGTLGMDDFSRDIINQSDLRKHFQIISLDVANGYMKQFADFVNKIRTKFPDIGIMAGNVVTPDGVKQIADAGADIIKVGIGSGSVCTTRRVAGVGYPQLSTLIDCRQMADECDVGLLSDGGCVHPGDISKAFAAGADIVMLGGMLAGHDEGADDSVVIDDGERRRFIFAGSSSSRALKNSKNESKYRTSEGSVVIMDAKGGVDGALIHIEGGLRSACSYTNSAKLYELRTNAKFIRVNRQLNEYFENQTIGI
jgi:GMP reductase